MGSKGMAATRHLRLRGKSQRGGKAKPDKALDHAPAGDLQRYMQAYLSALAVRNYSPETIEGRRSSLESFIDWCQERALLRAESISKRIFGELSTRPASLSQGQRQTARLQLPKGAHDRAERLF